MVGRAASGASPFYSILLDKRILSLSSSSHLLIICCDLVRKNIENKILFLKLIYTVITRKLWNRRTTLNSPMSLGKQDLVLSPDEALHENQNRRLLDSSYDFT